MSSTQYYIAYFGVIYSKFWSNPYKIMRDTLKLNYVNYAQISFIIFGPASYSLQLLGNSIDKCFENDICAAGHGCFIFFNIQSSDFAVYLKSEMSLGLSIMASAPSFF